MQTFIHHLEFQQFTSSCTTVA